MLPLHFESKNVNLVYILKLHLLICYILTMKLQCVMRNLHLWFDPTLNVFLLIVLVIILCGFVNMRRIQTKCIESTTICQPYQLYKVIIVHRSCFRLVLLTSSCRKSMIAALNCKCSWIEWLLIKTYICHFEYSTITNTLMFFCSD